MQKSVINLVTLHFIYNICFSFGNFQNLLLICYCIILAHIHLISTHCCNVIKTIVQLRIFYNSCYAITDHFIGDCKLDFYFGVIFSNLLTTSTTSKKLFIWIIYKENPCKRGSCWIIWKGSKVFMCFSFRKYFNFECLDLQSSSLASLPPFHNIFFQSYLVYLLSDAGFRHKNILLIVTVLKSA